MSSPSGSFYLKVKPTAALRQASGALRTPYTPLHHTSAHLITRPRHDLASDTRPPVAGPAGTDALRDAFIALHARNLDGFALLMCLGDLHLARRLAGEALAAGLEHLSEHRHPERAAAWLRARVVAALPRQVRIEARGIDALAEIGAVEAVARALAQLPRVERAAFVAREIEGFDLRDAAVVIGRDAVALDALLAAARQRYLRAYLDLNPPLPPIGPITQRVHEAGAVVTG